MVWHGGAAAAAFPRDHGSLSRCDTVALTYLTEILFKSGLKGDRCPEREVE